VYFAPILKGFPLKLGIALWVKKLEWWGYRDEKDVWRCHQPSDECDRQTPGDCKDRTNA